MKDYPAARLTVMALHWLRVQYPDALLTTELSIGEWGSALLDVAAVTESEIIGVEVKGDGDSPSRLERQGWVYARSATRMWLLPSPGIYDRCAKKRPQAWGMIIARGDHIDAETQWQRRPPDELPNSPETLASMLWAVERRVACSELLGVDSRGMTGHACLQMLKDKTTVADMRRFVCHALRNRNWANIGGRGSGKKVWQPCDPIEPPAARTGRN